MRRENRTRLDPWEERSSSTRKFHFSQVIPYILIAVLLVCFVVRDRQLSSRIEDLSAQVNGIHLQNDAISQEYNSLSVKYNSLFDIVESHKANSMQYDISSLEDTVEKWVDKIIQLYHETNRHSGTHDRCVPCMRFKYLSPTE